MWTGLKCERSPQWIWNYQVIYVGVPIVLSNWCSMKVTIWPSLFIYSGRASMKFLLKESICVWTNPFFFINLSIRIQASFSFIASSFSSIYREPWVNYFSLLFNLVSFLNWLGFSSSIFTSDWFAMICESFCLNLWFPYVSFPDFLDSCLGSSFGSSSFFFPFLASGFPVSLSSSTFIMLAGSLGFLSRSLMAS